MDNLQAFPTVTVSMTLRDYFAGQALGGMDVSGYNPSDNAEYAYRVADAMLKERADTPREYCQASQICYIHPLSSRMCELGTKSCIVEHSKKSQKIDVGEIEIFLQQFSHLGTCAFEKGCHENTDLAKALADYINKGGESETKTLER